MFLFDPSNEQDRSLSRSRTESGVSNASTVSLASPSSSAGPAAAASNGPAASGGAAGEDIVAAAQNATMADMTVSVALLKLRLDAACHMMYVLLLKGDFHAATVVVAGSGF